jgi:hypothetical protein
MSGASAVEELVIKVPAPFAGTEAVGFSTRYPEQRLDEPLRDVTFFVEGVPDLVANLWPHLNRFPMHSRRARLGYLWTDPIQLSNELVVISYRDRSIEMEEPGEVNRRYFANLLQPVIIPFLRDCVEAADLRLNNWIALTMMRGDEVLAELALQLLDLVPSNGSITLQAA